MNHTITVKSKCRECNGYGYYCDYHCDARGIKCTHKCNNGCDCEYSDGEIRVRDYEVIISDDVMKDINKQIDEVHNFE